MNTADSTLSDFLAVEMPKVSLHPATEAELRELEYPASFGTDPYRETLILDTDGVMTLDSLTAYVGRYHVQAGYKVEVFSAMGIPKRVIKLSLDGLPPDAIAVYQLTVAGRFFIH